MKKSLKYLAFAILLVTGISQANAQRGQGGGRDVSPEQRAEKQTERMTKQLSLSEKQAAKVAEINLKYAEKMKAEREAKSEERAEMRERFQQVRSEQDAELKTVLTTEQYEKLLAGREEMKQRRADKKGKKPAPEPAGDGGKG